ncbi:MAG TPA: hypothetical protein VEH09_00400 [Thermodesulfobacteriota bacterium]|nr:hypothetical protein [Thermodesulfobacteriota bacterium]
MRDRVKRNNLLLPPLVFLLLFLPAGCFYDLNLEAPSALNINPKKYQRVIFFPIPDAYGHPGSGVTLYSFIRGFLKEKGYVLVNEEAVAAVLEEMKLTTLLLLSDPEALVKIAERLEAKLLIIATIPEYKIQKSYWGPETFQVWDHDGDDYLSLPAYHRGTSQVRVILRFFESETGSLIWVAEGGIRAPSANAEESGRKLAERLLRDLPSLPRSMVKPELK